jgi:ankyrin repeat protein
MREKVIKGTLQSVIADFGDYAVDGTAEAPLEKHKGPCVRCLKTFGCWSLNLHESVMSGYFHLLNNCITKLMLINPLHINQYGSDGRTALSLAVAIKREDMVSLLLSKRALPDFPDQSTGRTPLIHSVLNGTHAISRSLLSHGASNSMADFNCITPLMLSCVGDDVLHCKILCSKLLDIDVQDENGWTALHYCALSNAGKCAAFLINEGANRNIKDGNNRKPIHLARLKESLNVTSALEDMKSRLADMGEEEEDEES